jgi:hypothetical protein
MQLQSESIGKISTDLTKFQAQMKGVKRTSENPFFKSSYADLAEVWDEIRAGLAGCGLSVAQRCDSDEFGVYLVTTLGHVSGEWLAGKLKLTPVKPNDPQALASAHTYARRYELMAITGLAPIDDDGNAGSDRAGDSQSRPPYQSPAKSSPRPAVDDQNQTGEYLHTSKFQLSDPITSKKGTIYWKAMDANQKTFYVWDNPICAGLQVAAGGLITVKIREDGKFPTIIEIPE